MNPKKNDNVSVDRSPENIHNSAESQPFRGVADTDVDQLVNLVEIHRGWGIDAEDAYRLVREGKLHRFRRRGHQAYYSLAELVKELGEPRGRLTASYGYSFELAIGA